MTPHQVFRKRSRPTPASVAIGIGAALAVICFAAAAQQRTGTAPRPAPAAPSPTLAALENTFWRCDHAATKGLLDIGAASICSEVTETLRKQKFDGDFDALLAWWQVNKPAQHHALDAAINSDSVASHRQEQELTLY
jgi:hypothetical protein